MNKFFEIQSACDRHYFLFQRLRRDKHERAGNPPGNPEADGCSKQIADFPAGKGYDGQRERPAW